MRLLQVLIPLEIPLGTLGVDESVQRKRCESLEAKKRVVSILTLAEEAGMSTGIVTTARVSHATPASAYAYSADRDWESDKDLKSKVLDDGTKCQDIGNLILRRLFYTRNTCRLLLSPSLMEPYTTSQKIAEEVLSY